MGNDPDERWEDIADTPLPRYALEESVVGRMWLLEEGGLWDANRPETELQALMEAAPNEEPVVSRDEIASRVDRLEWIVENVLSPEERDVIQVTVYAGHSIRKASEILGWPRSTVHRLKVSALKIIEREFDVGKN